MCVRSADPEMKISSCASTAITKNEGEDEEKWRIHVGMRVEDPFININLGCKLSNIIV